MKNNSYDFTRPPNYSIVRRLSGTTALTDDELFDFLNNTENATFGFFTVKIKQSNSIYLMAILSDIVYRSQKLFEKQVIKGPPQFQN